MAVRERKIAALETWRDRLREEQKENSAQIKSWLDTAHNWFERMKKSADS